ncbi:hypothetical protein D8674_034649 [Pyrus ussuriensis x Pyrus communis]|uniref:Uncharacterized protein n=1 Tax=Pyrus ussuriensis x Pyrus communis TaxID=2448454 RepID=A0A5N5GAQ2_9ROSA|nr:hypothetical protein D8674_034649 [Pyrus ussuriensis x Pyrus communis]
MQRRKPRGSFNDIDESAVVKAAAWAWFERGSCSDSKSIVPEFDLRRTCHAPYKPSRYKLEAMENIANISSKEDTEFVKLESPSVTTSSNSLLDTYEIESISRKLDQLIEFSGDRDKVHKGFLVGDVLGTKNTKEGGRGLYSDLEYRDKSSFPVKLQVPEDVRQQESVPLMDGNANRRKKKKNVRGGFWHRHAAICGNSEDVLNTQAFVVSRRRPEKGVYVRTGTGG